MVKLITAIFGAGVFGSIIALRKYVGIVLIMIVSTMIFKADIVDYLKQSSKQQHEEKLAQLNFENERMKIEAEKNKMEAEAKAQREQKEKAEIEFYQKEVARMKKEEEQKQKIERQKREAQQQESEALKKAALDSVCNRYENDYKRQMFCAATPNHHTCQQGYTPATWYNGAMTSRSYAVQMKCNVQY
jgi:flagellar biosynthesis GTPase FlhF